MFSGGVSFFAIPKLLDFIAKLAAQVPKPRVNLTLFRGVLAPNSKHRVNVAPARRGKGSDNKQDPKLSQDKQPVGEHQEMTWVQRFNRDKRLPAACCLEQIGRKRGVNSAYTLS